MDRERWTRLNALFHDALEREPDDRETFLEVVCGDDLGLRDDVRSLLVAHDHASALEWPAPGLELAVTPPVVDDSLVGRQLGPYRVTGLLGRGGMGVVYRGDDLRLRRPVAIKALPAAFTRDATRRARLQQEAMTAAALSHPGIATVFTLEEFEGDLYLVEEYVDGRTLRTVMSDGPMPGGQVHAIAVQVAQALAAAHARGVIHRDLKPDNVMCTPGGGIKVLDFGLARFQETTGETDGVRLTAAGTVLGTPGYMAPELLRGDGVDARADQFSFGVLLYELLTGAHPFEGADLASTMARVLYAEPRPVTELRPDCPPRLARIIRTCLAKHPDGRYPSTGRLTADLESPPGAGPASDPAPARPAPAASALWWWRFHQAAVSVVHGLTLYPLWLARSALPGAWGLVLFVAAVGVVGTTVNLRLHLWFTSRWYPGELSEQRDRAARWITATDLLLTGLLFLAALGVARDETALASVLVVFGVSLVVGARIIEPATTRAAFPGSPTR